MVAIPWVGILPYEKEIREPLLCHCDILHDSPSAPPVIVATETMILQDNAERWRWAVLLAE